MNNVRTEMIDFILSKKPMKFSGKENWLGVKMSPHQSFEFINEVTNEGIVTSVKKYSWSECSDQAVQTIYQRLKLNEQKLHK